MLSFKVSQTLILQTSSSSFFTFLSSVNLLQQSKLYKRARRVCLSINQRSFSSQAQNLEQSSNFSNSTSLLESNFFFSIKHSTLSLYSIMFFTYENRLVIFTKWFHNKLFATNMIVVDFIHQLCTKDVIICSKCNLTLIDWKSKKDSLQAHIDYFSWCAFAQKTQ